MQREQGRTRKKKSVHKLGKIARVQLLRHALSPKTVARLRRLYKGNCNKAAAVAALILTATVDMVSTKATVAMAAFVCMSLMAGEVVPA